VQRDEARLVAKATRVLPRQQVVVENDLLQASTAQTSTPLLRQRPGQLIELEHNGPQLRQSQTGSRATVADYALSPVRRNGTRQLVVAQVQVLQCGPK
jgi:hypothetical protein